MSVLSFGPFTFHTARYALYRRGTRVDLSRQPARVLELLLANRGHIVTRDQLRVGLWGDKIVEFETGLNYCMHQLRKKLDDDSRNPTYIETVAGEGYRFVGAVTTRSGRAARRATMLAAATVPLFLIWQSNRPPASTVTTGPVIAFELAASPAGMVSEDVIQELRETMDSALGRWSVAGASPSHLVSVTPERSPADSLDPVAWSFRFMTLQERDTLFTGTVHSRGLPADGVPVQITKGVTDAIEAFLNGTEPGIHRIQRSSYPSGDLPKDQIRAPKIN